MKVNQKGKFPNFQISKFPNFQISGLFLLKNQILSILFLCLLVLGGCKNELNEIGKEVQISEKQSQTTTSNFLTTKDEVKVVNGRLVFANQEAYNRIATQLTNMTENEMNTWESTMGFSSLRTYNIGNIESQVLSNIPPNYQTLLNIKGEYQIGASIIWFNSDGYAYIIENADEKLLKKLQSNTKNSSVRKMSFGIENISIKKKSGGLITASATIPGGIDARYQYQYNYGGHTYKMVFEVFSYVQPALGPYGWGYANDLYTAVKLEYRKNNGTWATAGETSTKTIAGRSYYITCAGETFSGGYFGGTVSTAGQGYYVRLNNYSVASSSPASWNVSIDGRYHENVPVHNQTYVLDPAIW
jgi:hypothetical protein